MSEAWAAIEQSERRSLAELFEVEPDRLSRFTVAESGIRFDFSKTHLDEDIVRAFERLAEAQRLGPARDELFSGGKLNVTEGRAVEHSAERGQGAPESVKRVRSARSATSSTSESAVPRSARISWSTRWGGDPIATMSPSSPTSMALRWRKRSAASIPRQL